MERLAQRKASWSGVRWAEFWTVCVSRWMMVFFLVAQPSGCPGQRPSGRCSVKKKCKTDSKNRLTAFGSNWCIPLVFELKILYFIDN